MGFAAYFMLPGAKKESSRAVFHIKKSPGPLGNGALGSTKTGTRTQDQLVKSQLLYQLSYLRVGGCLAAGRVE